MSIEIIDITPVVTVVEVPFTIQSGVVAPTNVTAPSIGADDPPRVEDTLGAWPGVWDQVVSAYAYQWYRDGAAISGATSQTYDLVDADEDAEITVGVVAANGEGSSAEEISPAVGPVEAVISPIAALALTAPTFGAGVYQVGETTPYTPGTYAGSGTVTVTRTIEFLLTGLWSPFPGLPTGADIGASTIEWGSLANVPEALRIKEVATNGVGFGVTQYSDPTVTVYAAGALPVSVTAPDTLITGVEVGDTVSTTGGEDDGQGAPITGYEYRYLRDGTPISGATSLTYTLVSADIGTTITPQRRAVTSVGSASAWASADAIDIPTVPLVAPVGASDVTAPSASGTPQVGETLTVDVGDYGGSAPITASAQRQVSADGSTGWADEGSAATGIANGGTTTYVPVVGDVGEYLRWQVTPTNDAGNGTLQTTDVLGPVLAAVATLRPFRASGTDLYLRTIATAQLTDSGSPDYGYDGTGGSPLLSVDDLGYDGTDIEAGDSVGTPYCWDATRDQGDGTVTGRPAVVRYDGTARGFDGFSGSDYVAGLAMTSQTTVSVVCEFTTPASFAGFDNIFGPGTPGGSYTTGIALFTSAAGGIIARTYNGGSNRATALVGGLSTSTDYVATVTVVAGAVTLRVYPAGNPTPVGTDTDSASSVDVGTGVYCIGGDVQINAYPAAIQRVAVADGVAWSTAVQDDLADGSDPTAGGTIDRSYDGVRTGVFDALDTDLLIYTDGTGADVTAQTS